MRAALTVGLLMIAGSMLPARAQPVTGSGAEVVWLSPASGSELDAAQGSARPVSLHWPRRIPTRGFLTTPLLAGMTAWVHIDGDARKNGVRFAFLSHSPTGTAVAAAVPTVRGPSDFVFTAPLGPDTLLGIGLLPGAAAARKPPQAQIWIGDISSPGYRWELWEEQAKRWAKNPSGPPPPPNLAGVPYVDNLALLRDALALAQAEEAAGGAAPGEAARITLKATPAGEALLRAAALLIDAPAREPEFPYFHRYDLAAYTRAGRPPMRKIHERGETFGRAAAEVKAEESLFFDVEGPGILHLEVGGLARAFFGDEELGVGWFFWGKRTSFLTTVKRECLGKHGCQASREETSGCPLALSFPLICRAGAVGRLSARGSDSPRALPRAAELAPG